MPKTRKKMTKARPGPEWTVQPQRILRERKPKKEVKTASLSNRTERLEKPIVKVESEYILPDSDVKLGKSYEVPLAETSKSGLCCCCLETSSPKSLWDKDESTGCAEVYGDMLGECFNLHFPKQEKTEQICDACVSRLRDAACFRRQVLACQDRLQALGTVPIKLEITEVTPCGEDMKNVPIKLERTEVNPECEDIKNDTSPMHAEPTQKPVKRKPRKYVRSAVSYILKTEDYRQQCNMYICRRCDREYAKRQYLQQHIKAQHLNIGFPCSHCELHFGTSSRLMRHKLREHSVDERYKCPICRDPFFSKEFLNRHVRRHGVIEAQKEDIVIDNDESQGAKKLKQFVILKQVGTSKVKLKLTEVTDIVTKSALATRLTTAGTGFTLNAKDFQIEGDVYKCNICSQTFNFMHFNKLKEHIKNIHYNCNAI